jgi:hypothetical protein
MEAEGQLKAAIEMLSGGRAGTPPDCQLRLIEILARAKGPIVGSKSANAMAQKLPGYFGRAIVAAAKGTRERRDMRGAWGIVEPLLSKDFPPIDSLPILQAAVESVPGEEELALVRLLVERAVESDANSAYVREIEGMFFERAAELDHAASSYRLALEAEPGRVTTLLRLAGITAASEPQGAIELIERALVEQELSVDPFPPGLFLASIAELPDSPELEGLLGSALQLAPASGSIALRLATMLEASGGESERIVRLANRAIRFGQGQDALALRDRARSRL